LKSENSQFPTLVTGKLIDHRAGIHPNRTFATFADGASWTYDDLRSQVRKVASLLRGVGVKKDDIVACWLPNGKDLLSIWFACNYLGAVFAPVNTAARGRQLEHIIALSEAGVLIVHSDLLEYLEQVNISENIEIFSCGSKQSLRSFSYGKHVTSFQSALNASEAFIGSAVELEPWQATILIFTSGTTGASKGVLVSYLQLANNAAATDYVTKDDRYLINLPMFHVGGVSPTFQMLLKGGSIAMIGEFSTSTFLQKLAESGATCAILLGVMARFLLELKPSPADREHSLRTACLVPLPKEHREFSARFRCATVTWFSMTEIGIPIISRLNPVNGASSGRLRPGYEARIVDDNDLEVPVGQPGELILRSDSPWLFMLQYKGNQEATTKAWRNGWFHTGDIFRVDSEGDYYFLDRKKDCIRRRGENVSSSEVESEILTYPGVKEVAVVAVPSSLGEDDIMAVVSVQKNDAVDPEKLIAFLVPRIAHYMIPRYLRFVGKLPKTPTNKVQKSLLREEGLTADTWDSVKNGVVIKRKKLM